MSPCGVLLSEAFDNAAITLGSDYLKRNKHKREAWVKLEEDLENYRHSTLFKAVWAETKLKFNGKPEAWSVNKLVSLS